MAALTTILIVLVTLISNSDAAACQEITDETSCLLQASCGWQDDPNESIGETSCYCNSQEPLDVIFLLDESGSMGYTHFRLEVQFVIDMIEQSLAPDSNVHITKFGSKMRAVWNFTQDQSNGWSSATTALDSTYYYGGGTKMSDALRYAQKVFNNQWSGTNDRLLVFLTDGVPSYGYDPCSQVEGIQNVVGDEGIVVIGMGSYWTVDSIKCMVTPGYSESWGASNPEPDYDRILEVTEFNSDDFDAAAILASEFLCPEPFDLKVTEVSIEEFTNGQETYHTRFVEFYNPGDNMTLSQGFNNFKFEGFLTSTLFGQGAVADCDIVIDEGQYVVIYDPDAPDNPECLKCNCTLDGNTQCNNALYVPCNSDQSTSGCGACTWDTTMTNDNWYQKAYDAANDGLLSSVIRNDSNGWSVNVYTGYTTELISKSASSSSPSNWQMSCTERGTPGAGKLSNCSVECIPDICKSQGDANATCNTQYDICDCTAQDHYHVSTTSGCAFLQPPINCYVDNLYDTDYDMILAEIHWSKDGLYESGVFFEVTDPEQTSTTYGYSSYRGYQIAGTANVTVRAGFDDPVNGMVYSTYAVCPITTVSPTPEPTPTPTDSNADISSCTATVWNDGSGGYTIDLEWDAATQNEATDISGPYTYYIFGELIPGDSSTTISQFTTVTDETITSDTLEMSTNPPNISVVTAIYIEGEQVYDFDLMKEDGAGKADCNFITQNPTPSPTTDPTSEPTTDPTGVPSMTPTSAPTYAAWNIEDCTVTIPQYGDNVAKPVIFAQFTYSKDNDDVAPNPLIALWVNGVARTTTGLSESLTKTFAEHAIEKVEIEEAMSNNGFQARIEYWGSGSGDSWTESDLIQCDFTSESPTISPTADPTSDPTADPTGDPTEDPTAKPTGDPTASPTFQGLVLGDCTVEVSSDLNTLIITFVEPFYNESDAAYPSSSEISYIINIGENETESTYTVAASSSEGTRVYPINDYDGFEIGTTLVSVDIADEMGIGDPRECELITQVPTVSPTTPSPTDYPTTDSPWITLNVEADWGFDGDCVFPDNSDRRRRRLQDTDSNATILVDEYCPNCPVCSVLENDDVKYIRVSRTPVNFEFDVIIRLRITYLDDTNGDGISKTDFDLDRIDTDWHDLVTSTGRYTEGYILGTDSGNDGELVIPYYLSTSDEDGESAEAFMIEVMRCDVDESAGAVNAVPDGLVNVYDCNLGADYPAVIISIEDLVERDTLTETQFGDIPTWVWYPVVAAAVLIPILVYLIWRFWNQKKIADALEIQRKHELEEAEKQDDVGHYGVVGDHVNANPLATGDAFEIPKVEAIIDHQLAIEKMHFEHATVEVEHNVFKQDFGPVKAERTTHV